MGFSGISPIYLYLTKRALSLPENHLVATLESLMQLNYFNLKTIVLMLFLNEQLFK